METLPFPQPTPFQDRLKSLEGIFDARHALIAPGQGNQEVGMGQHLAFQSEAAYDVWHRVNRAMIGILDCKLSDLVWHGTPEVLTRTHITQPAIVTDSLARWAALEESGQLGNPGWHTGNSLGLYTALATSGAMDIEEAVVLSARRGEAFRRAINEGPPTTLVALNGISADKIEELRKKYDLEVCLINTPMQTVLGGLRSAVEELAQEEGLGQVLDVEGAYHSKYMAPAVDDYREVVANAPIKTPTNGILVAGAGIVRILITPDEIRQALVDQLTHTENWAGVMDVLRKTGVAVTTELNGTPRLSTMNRRQHGGKSQSINLLHGIAGEKPPVIAYRWVAPEQ